MPDAAPSPAERRRVAFPDLPAGWTTRFAPAPTGWLHLGHAVNAAYVWGCARAFGGRVLLRIEDHDLGRTRAEYERGIHEDLAWLGLVPDAVVPPQRERGPAYDAALAALDAQGLVYPCTCSRAQIEADAPGGPPGETAERRYPGTCRARGVDPGATFARRVVMASGAEHFGDLRLGPQSQEPATQCGDVLARERRGFWTYQFAVTVDDHAQRVDVVIRGEDLLASTGRQLRLARLLGRAQPPTFLHHPLVRNADGTKLSKSAGDTALRALRAAGATPHDVLGRAAWLGGLQVAPQPVDAAALAALVAGLR